ncbi:hypothetical protein Bbelb_141090 [Branchiostoma belcheri]|nr:hypothetical protein Bbelb_141090 [Branchiostoma belcheri]
MSLILNTIHTQTSLSLVLNTIRTQANTPAHHSVSVCTILQVVKFCLEWGSSSLPVPIRQLNTIHTQANTPVPGTEHHPHTGKHTCPWQTHLSLVLNTIHTQANTPVPEHYPSVVQFYLEWGSSSLPVPIRQLINFTRVTLLPNQQRFINVTITAREMAVYTDQWVVPAVGMTVFAGGQQPLQNTAIVSNVAYGTFTITGKDTPLKNCGHVGP